jgi:nucleotide-binding universal stress UspA family protein
MHLCDLLLRLGRPVLAVPSGASGLELNEVLVCWKDSREARRAVADALPMLQVSKRVDVVEIVEAEGVGQSRRRLDSVGDWLARNGVESHCSAEVSTGAEFGHSRLRERAFGGVTKNLLLGADCCVLASHEDRKEPIAWTSPLPNSRRQARRIGSAYSCIRLSPWSGW